MNRWPHRPATLIRRFERAVLAKAAVQDSDSLEVLDKAHRDVELARRDLLARIEAVTLYQQKHRP